MPDFLIAPRSQATTSTGSGLSLRRRVRVCDNSRGYKITERKWESHTSSCNANCIFYRGQCRRACCRVLQHLPLPYASADGSAVQFGTQTYRGERWDVCVYLSCVLHIPDSSLFSRTTLCLVLTVLNRFRQYSIFRLPQIIRARHDLNSKHAPCASEHIHMNVN